MIVSMKKWVTKVLLSFMSDDECVCLCVAMELGNIVSL